MTALAANLNFLSKEAGLHAYPIADSTHIYKGATVAVNASGYAVPAADTAGYVVVGIAWEEVDNTTTGHTAGRYNIRVAEGRYVQRPASGMAQSSVGQLAYAADDNVVAVASGVTNNVLVGVITGYLSSSLVEVYIPPPLLDDTIQAGLAAINVLNMSTRRAKVALGVADTGGGILAWQAPVACYFRELMVDVTTKSTGACTADFGPAANGTTLNDTMIDGLDVGTAAIVASSRDATNGGDTAAYTDAVLTFKKMAAGAWITGSKASGSAAGLVGFAYISYQPV